MTNENWHTINDEDTRAIWECPECYAEAIISPTFYTENGTPMCTECDKDMIYVRTEVKG